MWNNLYDEKGRKRANFFYKAAFYDRDAFINFDRRYTINTVPFDNYESDATYDDRKTKPWYGIIKDSGKEIYRTSGEVSKDGSIEVWDIEKHQRDIVLKVINEKYPDWENINAYWD